MLISAMLFQQGASKERHLLRGMSTWLCETGGRELPLCICRVGEHCKGPSSPSVMSAPRLQRFWD